MLIILKYLLGFTLTVCVVSLNAQVKINPVLPHNWPSNLSYKGKVDSAITWKDINGVHYIIRSFVSGNRNEKNGSCAAQLYGYHYLIFKNDTLLIWKMQDGITDCQVDCHTRFIPNSFSVTDLDKDNIPEIWNIYSLACRGDISSSDLKIIMYQGSKKYAMRGKMISNLSSDEPGAGKYTFDSAFKNAAPAFKGYAMLLWEKYKIEKW